MNIKVTEGDNLSKTLSLVSYAAFGIVIVIIVGSYFISMKMGTTLQLVFLNHSMS